MKHYEDKDKFGKLIIINGSNKDIKIHRESLSELKKKVLRKLSKKPWATDNSKSCSFVDLSKYGLRGLFCLHISNEGICLSSGAGKTGLKAIRPDEWRK